MLESTPVYHFVEGLRQEQQMKVLKAKPKILTDAVETAKDFDALLSRTTQSKEGDQLAS